MPYNWLQKSPYIFVICGIAATCTFTGTDARFPDEPLQPVIDFLLSATYASATWALKYCAQNNFLFFLFTTGCLVSTHKGSKRRYLPRTIGPSILAGYLAHLYRADYSWNTISQYLYHVRSWLVKLGYPDPTFNEEGVPDQGFYACYRAIKKLLHGDKKVRYPITPYHITQFFLRLKSRKDNHRQVIDNLDEILALNLWLAVLLMWYGLLRTSEIHSKNKLFVRDVSPSREHLTFHPSRENPQYIELRILDCKTTPDPSRKGFVLRLYKQKSARCPVKTAKELFDKSPGLPGDPLIDYRTQAERKTNKAPKTAMRLRFTKWITKLLAASGVDDGRELKRYTSHSFRQGAACTLARSGLSLSMLKLAGRWKSNAVELYIALANSSPQAIIDIGARLDSAPLINDQTINWDTSDDRDIP